MVKEVSEEETVRASWEGSSHLGLLQQLRVNTGSPDPVPTISFTKNEGFKKQRGCLIPKSILGAGFGRRA